MFYNIFFRALTSVWGGILAPRGECRKTTEELAIEPPDDPKTENSDQEAAQDVARIVHTEVDAAVAVEQGPKDKQGRHDGEALLLAPPEAREELLGKGAGLMPEQVGDPEGYGDGVGSMA